MFPTEGAARLFMSQTLQTGYLKLYITQDLFQRVISQIVHVP